MSSSYSSSDWVLSHLAHFTVPRFICVYVCVFFVLSCHTAYVLYYCNTVGWTWWYWSLILRTFLQCFDTVGWVIWSVKTRPRYIMCLVGRYNITQSVGRNSRSSCLLASVSAVLSSRDVLVRSIRLLQMSLLQTSEIFHLGIPVYSTFSRHSSRNVSC